MKSESFNIALYPPADISRRAIAVSRTLKERGGLFALDGERCVPHITLYFAEIPLQSVPQVKQVLSRCAKHTEPFRLSSLAYHQDESGYVHVACKKSPAIQKLQQEIIEAINPLRQELLLPKDMARMHELPKAQQRNLQRYGFRSVGKQFSPHLTFTKLARYTKNALQGIGEEDFSFDVTRIGLFVLGEHGTCRKLIKTFDFS
ncbi:2'-5' RNA ligase family protein [Candidatus Uhrbacteria bacterium]|nr:2'-5' RNA ligase family protein [Candidatus Uhrbacteria bacterium]